ncbi:MAG: hypothetical protein RIT45_4217 [Pseudomonadota bacterium]
MGKGKAAAAPRMAAWTLGEQLAAGGGGAVFAARHDDDVLARHVIKRVPREDAASVARLRAEARLLLEIPCPALPDVVAWLPPGHDGFAGLVLERRAGERLDAALPARDLATFARAGEAALVALMAVHASGAVHGDLHPGNVLLDARGNLSLLDLGLAARRGTVTDGPGLPAYASPERLRDEPVDPRDDLFSLAMTLWRSLGLPAPFADYPAIMPGDRDRAEVPAKHPAAAMLRVLAGWLHPRRALRPGHAEAALREWRAVAGALLHEGPTPLGALAGRSWICAGVPGQPEVALDGDAVLVGPAGSGRTGALRGVALQARGPVAWLRGRFGAFALERAEQEALRVGTVAERNEDAELAGGHDGQAVEGGLGGAAAAAQARVDARLRAIGRGLGAEGVLLVDDFDALPAAVAEAVASLCDSAVEGRARVVIAAGRTLDLAGPRQLVLQPMRAEEVAESVQAADGGRAWDAGLSAAIAGSVGLRRDRVWRLVAALVEQGALLRSPDRVEAASLEIEATVQATLAALEQPPAPPSALLPVLAHLLVDGDGLRGGADDPAPAVDDALLDAWPWLRRRRGGGLMLDAAALARVREAVPAELRAAAALARAEFAGNRDPDRALALRLQAARAGAPLHVRTADIARRAEACLQAGDAAAALETVQAFAELNGALDDAATALGVRAATALGRFDDVESLLAGRHDAPAGEAQLRDAVDLHLALAESHFRRGAFPEARADAEKALGLLEVRTDQLGDWPREAALGLVLRAFAATWQGDLEAARLDLERGRTVTSPWPELRAQVDYLDALCRYYAGEIEIARRGFDALVGQAVAPAITAAAAAGVGLCAQRGGDLLRARMAYDESRRLAERAGDRARVLNMTMNLATIDHEAGDLGLAMDGYDRVVTGALRLGNEGARVRALVNRGNLAWLLGLCDAASADLETALPLLASSGNTYLEGNVRCVLAEFARGSGRLDAAAALIGSGIARLEEVGAASELAELRLEAAWLAIARGELPEARRAAEEVEGRAAALQSEELAARALHVRARVAWHSAMAEAATPREAARHLDTALGLLSDASGRMPSGKVIGGVRIDADRALLLAATGRAGDAQIVARAALERLDRVAATLQPDVRRRFVASPTFAAARDILTVCVRVGSRETHSSAGSFGSSVDFTIGRAAHHAVMAINQRLSAEHDQERLLETLMDSAITLTGAERGFLLLDTRDPDASDAPLRAPLPSELQVAVARNLDGENLRKPAHKLSHSLALEVFDSGEPVLATDAQLDPRFAEQESVHTGGLRSILCVPLISRGRTIGVIYVDNRFAAGAFSREHATILEALASQAAIAIHTARLIGRLRQREAELEHSRAEVVALNARLEAELASTEDALVEARRQLLSERGDAARRSDYDNIRGESPQLHRLFKLIDRVRDHDFPVLVIGESGTGKELVARAIHFTGTRKASPFVAINCGALPENLLESELFGHVRGAFTGAVGDRRGLFEQAHGGTLFLDEIGEMPAAMQVKLLRVLQTGEITRVGGSGSRRVDVRVVAATHRDLDRMVRDGDFREDLLYRLRVVDLHVPPLRDRAGDLELLADHFLAQNRKAGLGDVRRITKGALRRMRSYGWPGNVRELETFLKSACLFAESDTLDVPDVAPLLERAEGKAARRSGGSGGGMALPAAAPVLTGTLAEIERAAILGRLESHGGNKRRTAESLGIDRGTLYNKLRAYGEHDPA